MSHQSSAHKVTSLASDGSNYYEWCASLELATLETLGGDVTSCVTSLADCHFTEPVKPKGLKEDTVAELLFHETVKTHAAKLAKYSENLPKLLGVALNSLSPAFLSRLTAQPSYAKLHAERDTIAMLKLIQAVALGSHHLDGTTAILEKIQLYTLRMPKDMPYETYVNMFNTKVRRIAHLKIDIPAKELALIFLFNLDSGFFGTKVADLIDAKAVPETFDEAKVLVANWLTTRRNVLRLPGPGKKKEEPDPLCEETACFAKEGCWYCKMRNKNHGSHDANQCRSLRALAEKAIKESKFKREKPAYFAEEDGMVIF